ncbi:MAG: hypothetical protein ACKVS9_19945 [Phycisphaerae bacterium]
MTAHRTTPRLVAIAIALAFAACGPFTAHAQALEDLTYTLTPQFGTGRLKVEITWATRGRTQSALGVAPAFGRIDDVPGMLIDVTIDGAQRKRKDGALWIMLHEKGATLSVSYTVNPGRRNFANWDDVHRPIAGEDFFHGIGNAFLMVPNSGEGVPGEFQTQLTWRLPAGQKAVCSWAPARSAGAPMTPADLRHSVYLAGNIATRKVQREGRSVTVAMPEAFEFSIDDFANLTSAIIDEQIAFMADKGFPSFVVTAIPAGGKLREGETRLAGSGLYHSFAMFAAPNTKLDDGVVHLFAHELFHYWNGRVLGAAQPERLAYWFVEGLTDYYALRILFESKRWDAATYAKWLNKHLREYAVNPAVNATNQDINKKYWSERDTVGQVAYQRGLMLGLRWHHLARQKGVREGIDKLFRHLVNRGRAGGFEVGNDAIRTAGIQQLGAWFGEEFDRHVTRAERVTLPDGVLLPALVGESRDTFAFELGFERVRSLRDKKVRGVIAGSAAATAGLLDGDELTGWTIPTDADSPVVLQVKRGGSAKTIEYFPRGRKQTVLQFEPAAVP